MSYKKKNQLKKLSDATRQLERRDFASLKLAAMQQEQVKKHVAKEPRKSGFPRVRFAAAALVLLVVTGISVSLFLSTSVPEVPTGPEVSAEPTEPNDYGGVYQSLTDAFEKRKEIADNIGGIGGRQFLENIVQTEDVEEADMVQKDEKRLYTLTALTEDGETKYKVSVVDMETFTLLDQLVFEDSQNDSISGILVKNGRLIVLGGKLEFSEQRGAPDGYTVIRIYNISENGQLTFYSEFRQEGSYDASSFLFGDSLYLISQALVKEENEVPLTEETVIRFIPQLYNSMLGEESYAIPAQDIHISENPGSQYTVITAISLEDPAGTETKAVLGSPMVVYVKGENLYVLSNQEYAGLLKEREDVFSHIVKYQLGNGSLALQTTGNVPGSFINQFSQNEYEGNLRMMTVQGDENDGNYILYVLNDSLDIIGQTEVLEQGEVMESVHYTDEAVYMRVWEEPGKVYAADLSNPQQPQALGPITTSEFAGYLLKLNGTTFLNICDLRKVSDEEVGLRFSILDVADPENPAVRSEWTLSGYCTSQAFYDSNLVTYMEGPGLLAIPLEVYGEDRSEFEMVGYHDNGSILVIELPQEGEIHYCGSIQGPAGAWDQAAFYYEIDPGFIRRILYENGVLYTVSGQVLTKVDAETFTQLAQLDMSEDYESEITQ